MLPTFPRRRRLLTFALAASMPALAGAQGDAGRVNGFDPVARVADTELRLNGTGFKGWFKAYAAALYLRGNARTPEQAVTMAGPKRLALRMNFDIPAVEFSKALHIGMGRNVSAAEMDRLQPRLQKFQEQVKAISKVHTGDVIDLDHEPGRGMSMRVNGKLRGEPIPGDDFFSALLRSFLGDKPYDPKLKAGLLGATA